ncbi:MAG: hypothetical protein WBB30_06420 [Solirubrobacterales bacterium]
MAERTRGQAQVEFIALLPALVGLAVLALQLMAFGYSQSLADGAAEAGAVAIAGGRPAAPAARAALPGWADSRVEVDVAGGSVEVALRPPALLPVLGGRLQAHSVAWVRTESSDG